MVFGEKAKIPGITDEINLNFKYYVILNYIPVIIVQIFASANEVNTSKIADIFTHCEYHI